MSSTAAFSGAGQERYRKGGSCGGTAWLQMGGVPYSTPKRKPLELGQGSQGRIFRKSVLLKGFRMFPICRFPLNRTMCQRRTPKIASAPLRRRCQPRIVMRRRHSKGRSLDNPLTRVGNGPQRTIWIDAKLSWRLVGTFENSKWQIFMLCHCRNQVIINIDVKQQRTAVRNSRRESRPALKSWWASSMERPNFRSFSQLLRRDCSQCAGVAWLSTN